jgi:hypothetical protein
MPDLVTKEFIASFASSALDIGSAETLPPPCYTSGEF